MRGRTMLAVSVVVGLVVGLATVAVAGNIRHAQRVGVGPHAGISQSARGVSAVVVATSDFNDTSNSSVTLSQLPGMTAKIKVPAGKQALLDMRFSSESACYGGGTGANWCIVEILVDGVEASPGDGGDMAFDSTDTGHEDFGSWEAHALERAIVVGPGTHTVKVIGGVTDISTTGTQIFYTGERTLVVERAYI